MYNVNGLLKLDYVRARRVLVAGKNKLNHTYKHRSISRNYHISQSEMTTICAKHITIHALK